MRDRSTHLQNAVFVPAHDHFVCVRQDVEESARTGAAVDNVEMATNVANCRQDGIGAGGHVGVGDCSNQLAE